MNPAPPAHPTVADPGRWAIATQVAIVLYTLLLVGDAIAGGTRSEFFLKTVALALPLMLAACGCFLAWLHRCRLNAEAFAPGTQHHSAGYAIGGWFIPVAMWWIPRRVVLDVWRASGGAGSWLVETWWVAWLANTVGVAVIGRVTGSLGYDALSAAIHVVAAGLAVWLVQRVTAAQRARAAAPAKAAGGPDAVPEAG
ncbi:hypothetical protein GCM10010441_18660 [Kitasatospora paracochleata]|uniref:DUF4328 domain-containing protein n=1 Tax=Kitasatospora paracochleata TaxID=58354 RepID=A0ABT1J3J3_9ACTN|nr:DUF4328 domain-containing protein [Kitasatospora paracochleata]MCP2311997.1 hypothetical protein [Kitasatospora paracochleata]